MTKTELHQLIDALPGESLLTAAILLRRAQDPVAARLDVAPHGDEELTEEDHRVIKEARSKHGISGSDAEVGMKAVMKSPKAGRKDREQSLTFRRR